MSITRRKFVSLFASMALALSLVGIAPAAAYADDATTGSIKASATEITVTTGSSTDLSQYFDKTGVDGDYHFDYVLTSGSGATVNKHSGAFVPTTTADQDYTVTVYLMNQPKHTSDPGKPCSKDNIKVLDQVTLTIHVKTANASYGYQGSGKNTIMVTDPAVTDFSYDADDDMYVNELSAPSLSEDGDYYIITYMQNAGFQKYDGATKYTERNKGNIALLSGDNEIATLGDGSGVLVVDSATHATKTIVLKIKKSSDVVLGHMTLEFAPELRGNNDTGVVLGSTVQFNF